MRTPALPSPPACCIIRLDLERSVKRLGVVKSYSRPGSVAASRPSLLFQVKIDSQDVRTGCRVSDDGFFQAEWLPDTEMDWARDMVVRYRGGELREIDPPRQLGWPEGAEERLLAFLARHYRVRVWRNPEVGLYSLPAEEKAEFVQRCRDALLPERAARMKKLREIFHHRYFELEQRLKEETLAGDEDPDLKQNRLARLESLFSDAKEGLSRWFVEDGNQLIGEGDLTWELRGQPDFQERIDALMADFATGFNRICSEFEEKASRIDEYDIPINRGAVDIVLTGILWE